MYLNNLEEKHFHNFRTHSSIFNVGKFKRDELNDAFLFANYNANSAKYVTKQNIDLVTFSVAEDSLKPKFQTLDLAGLPINSEIIAIQTSKIDLLYCISTLVTLENEKNLFIIHYSECLDEIGESFSQTNLAMLPIMIKEIRFWENDKLQTAFLLSGENTTINESYNDLEEGELIFTRLKVFSFSPGELSEMPVSEVYKNFPEFSYLPNKDLVMSFHSTIEQDMRYCVFGTLEGSFLVTQTNIKDLNVIKKVSFSQSFMIVDIRFMPNNRDILVASAIEPVVIYYNIFEEVKDGEIHAMLMRNQIVLEGSNHHDCITSVELFDIDLDGEEELIIGTFDSTLLCFKKQSTNNQYKMVDKRTVHGAVHRCYALNIFDDATKSLIVMTTRGLHVFQQPVKQLLDTINQQMSSLLTDF